MADSKSVENLLDIIRSYPNMRISATDLHKLTPDTVIPIYMEFLKALGIDVENLKNPLSTETKFHLSHYDAEVRFIMKLYSMTDAVIKECSFYAFDLTDILKPDLVHTATIATILHNLVLFRNSREETLDEVVQEGSERIETFRKMTALTDKRRNEINFQSKQKAEIFMQRDQFKRQITEAEERVIVALEERQNITESIKHTTKTLVECDNKIGKLETECNKLNQTIENLKNQIVQAPEELVMNLDNLKATEQQLKEQEQNISKEIQQKKSRCENLIVCAHLGTAVGEEVKDLNKLIHEIRNEDMLVEQLETEKTTLKEKISVKKEVIKIENDTEVELGQQIKSLHQHLADKKKTVQKKMKAIEMELAKQLDLTTETVHIMKEHIKQLEECKSNIAMEQDRWNSILLKTEIESQDVILEVTMLIHSFNHFRQTLSELESCEE